MSDLYKVVIITPRNSLLNTYEVRDLEILKDDLTYQYPNLNVDKLIQNKEYIDDNSYKYLFHHFTW